MKCITLRASDAYAIAYAGCDLIAFATRAPESRIAIRVSASVNPGSFHANVTRWDRGYSTRWAEGICYLVPDLKAPIRVMTGHIIATCQIDKIEMSQIEDPTWLNEVDVYSIDGRTVLYPGLNLYKISDLVRIEPQPLGRRVFGQSCNLTDEEFARVIKAGGFPEPDWIPLTDGISDGSESDQKRIQAALQK